MVWTQHIADGQADVLHYCRIPRGARRCGLQRTFVPPEGNPSLNLDPAGPRIVELGPEQLELLTFRYPNGVTVDTGTGEVDDQCFAHHPGDPGACYGSSVKIWRYRTDDDGLTWSDARVLDHGQTPVDAALLRHPTRIGTVSNTSGSTAFQAVGPDGYTNARAELGNEGPDRAYNGSLGFTTAANTRPVVAFSDLNPNVYFRVFQGGNLNDVGSWGSTRTVGKGDEPRLASGPHGLYLMYRRRVLLREVYVVRHFAGPDFGPSTTVSSAPISGAGPLSGRDIFEDPGGGLHVAWVEPHPGAANVLYYRTSDDGHAWSPPRSLAASTTPVYDVDLSAAEDGGGLAVWDSDLTGDGTVSASYFGTQQPLYDVRTNAIEVTQAIQRPDLPVRDLAHPDADVPYDGVPLAAGRRPSSGSMRTRERRSRLLHWAGGCAFRCCSTDSEMDGPCRAVRSSRIRARTAGRRRSAAGDRSPAARCTSRLHLHPALELAQPDDQPAGDRQPTGRLPEAARVPVLRRE